METRSVDEGPQRIREGLVYSRFSLLLQQLDQGRGTSLEPIFEAVLQGLNIDEINEICLLLRNQANYLGFGDFHGSPLTLVREIAKYIHVHRAEYLDRGDEEWQIEARRANDKLPVKNCGGVKKISLPTYLCNSNVLNYIFRNLPDDEVARSLARFADAIFDFNAEREFMPYVGSPNRLTVDELRKHINNDPLPNRRHFA